MKKYVFTVMEDICVANGKDVAATELIRTMNTYGKVEDYDTVVAGVKAEYQSANDALVAKYNEIADQKLTVDEIAIINEYRKQKASIVQASEAKAKNLENQLTAIKNENENRNRQILALLGK